MALVVVLSGGGGDDDGHSADEAAAELQVLDLLQRGDAIIERAARDPDHATVAGLARNLAAEARRLPGEGSEPLALAASLDALAAGLEEPDPVAQQQAIAAAGAQWQRAAEPVRPGGTAPERDDPAAPVPPPPPDLVTPTTPITPPRDLTATSTTFPGPPTSTTFPGPSTRG